MWLPYRSSAIILFVRTAGSGNAVVQTVVLVVLGVGDLCKCWMKVIRQHVLETQLHFLSVLPVSCLPSPCFARGLKALEEVKVNTRLPPAPSGSSAAPARLQDGSSGPSTNVRAGFEQCHADKFGTKWTAAQCQVCHKHCSTPNLLSWLWAWV